MRTSEVFRWIDDQKKLALDLLVQFANINSHSCNLKGLKEMLLSVKQAFLPLPDLIEEVTTFPDNPPTLVLTKRSTAPHKILLGGHMDTVYPEDQSFPVELVKDRLYGPGVADMKGGLIVALLALKTFEKFVENPNFGWVFICNPDEEIGSPYSKSIWESYAKDCAFGLLFEPAFADGGFVKMRKGSMTFSLEVKGTPAHVGRAFHEGKNAVHALARLIDSTMNSVAKLEETTLNYAHLEGGHALNIVSSFAKCKGNLRAFQERHLKQALEILIKQMEEIKVELGVEFKLEILQTKSPKVFDEKSQALFSVLEKNAKELNIPYRLHASGGLSDGNILSSAGLSSIDTLGVVGGNLHTPNEYMEAESLIERIKLTFLLLNDFNQNFFSSNVKS